eukprot:4849901-Lingulodinium_polyedra.AAC.1
MAAESLVHGKAKMRVSPRRNERLVANSTGPVRKSNDVNEEMDRLEPNGSQQIKSGQVEMQSINDHGL